MPRKKRITMMPVRINGTDFQFSSGKHNELQKALLRNLRLDSHQMRKVFMWEIQLLKI